MRRQNSEQSKQRLSATMLALRTANKKRPCAICLRKVGFGMTRTCRALRVGKATVSRWYKQAGISINPERNGVALRGTGYRAGVFGRRKAAIQRKLATSRRRVLRCLSKKPPRPRSGVTPAQRFKQRYHNSPEFRIYQLCRRRLKKVLHGVKKAGKCMELVGCTTGHLRAHIQSQFVTGMTWVNSGTGEGRWHIDHRRPCASFDLTDETQQRECFHWTNLQPLWSLDNIRKGAKLTSYGSLVTSPI